MVGVIVSNRWLQQGRAAQLLDRVLMGVCAAIWLVLLGVSVVAAVALGDLGRKVDRSAHNTYTGVLYAVIGISALIILAAIPLLLRSRRGAVGPADQTLGGRQPPPAAAGGQPGSTRRMRRNRAANELAESQMDRALLRGAVELAGGIGLALVGVALATYLMAVGKGTAAWVTYGLAGLVTATLPAIPWLYLRELRSVLNLSGLG